MLADPRFSAARRIAFVVCSIFMLALTLSGSHEAAAQSNDIDLSIIEEMLEEHFLIEATSAVAFETWRDAQGSPESEMRVAHNFEQFIAYLNKRADAFNATQKTLKLRPFQWRADTPDNNGKRFWIFGFRLGTGENVRSILTHGDTVAPGNLSWKPFNARVEKRMFNGKMRDFIVGRGTSDDKGATIVAFNVLKALAKRLDGANALEDWTLELIIDTSEETGMSTPHYLKEPGVRPPAFGIVFDATWTIRGEKGSERPTFSVENKQSKQGLWVERIEPTPGPINQLPDHVVVRIEGDSREALDVFAETVTETYAAFSFDDVDYRRADLFVERDGAAVLLSANVSGAQHGSAPHANRAEGANPLVSLTNFVAHLKDEGVLSENGIARMCEFIAWAWGTRVFGEHHPDLLERNDDVFTQGNGTTYAITQFSGDGENVTLGVDIRYALGHNATPWDGKTEGLVGGKSIFSTVFPELFARFQAAHPGSEITVETRTGSTPDLRNPDNPHLLRLKKVYEQVVGPERPFQLRAIGGGTDAKGHPELIAAGPLFDDTIGPPINLHGLNEAAPLDDLKLSAKILYLLFLNEVLGK